MIERDREEPNNKEVTVVDFYRRAIEDSNHPVDVVSEKYTRKQGDLKKLTIFLAYVESEVSSMQDIGDSFGYTREWVSKCVEQVSKTIWNTCSSSTKKEIPFNTLVFRRETSLLLRQKYSDLRGGKSATVARALQGGETVDLSKLDTTPAKRSSVKLTLKRWGFTLPSTIRTREETRQLEEKLRTGTTQEIGEVFKGVQINRNTYYKYSEGADSLLVALHQAIDGFGYSQKNYRNIIPLLEQNGIPVKVIENEVKSGLQKGNIQRHYCLARVHLDKARKILESL